MVVLLFISLDRSPTEGSFDQGVVSKIASCGSRGLTEILEFQLSAVFRKGVASKVSSRGFRDSHVCSLLSTTPFPKHPLPAPPFKCIFQGAMVGQKKVRGSGRGLLVGVCPPVLQKLVLCGPVLVRVVGELRAANPSKCPRAHEATC